MSEDLQKELEKLKKQVEALENDKLKLSEEVSSLRKSKYHDWTIKHRTTISTIFKNDKGHVGRIIAVAGWIKTLRMGGADRFAFVKVYDGSTYLDLQVVVDGSVPGFDAVVNGTASIAASVLAIGEIILSKGKGQKIEMQAHEFRLLGPSNASEYPLSKKKHNLETLRSYPMGHFRPRTNFIGAVSRIRNSLAFATHLFFQNKGFYYVNTPLITASDCEGAGEMFQVTTIMKDKVSDIPHTTDGKVDYSQDFFKRPAYLTVSGQLNAEIYACAMGSVYTFGPTFRAENSNTSRHLAEFWMIEPEIAFADLYENMNVAEEYVKFTMNYVLENNPYDLEFLESFEKESLKEKIDIMKDEAKTSGKKLPSDKEIRGFRDTPLRERIQLVASSDFGRVTYTDAVEILKNSGVKFEVDVYWGLDLGSEHERWLAEKHFKKPVIVTNYPKEFKAFYMRLDEGGKTVSAMDVLVPGVGELIGGSQREERLDVLLERIKDAKLEVELYDWYLDLRKFGSVTHSGFGLGFERLVCYVTGAENIRDSIPFPRYPGHAEY
jgi:asparaginyl-tRNA synthetase